LGRLFGNGEGKKASMGEGGRRSGQRGMKVARSRKSVGGPTPTGRRSGWPGFKEELWRREKECTYQFWSRVHLLEESQSKRERLVTRQAPEYQLKDTIAKK